MTVDRFGVPSNLLGDHGEDFYGLIGRIAGLSALLEHQAHVVYETMINATQDQCARLPAGQLVCKALKEANSVEDESARLILQDYFSRVAAALKRRNDFIHNLWPAQADGRLFGWRPSRAKSVDPKNPDETLETTLAEAKDFVLNLVSLVQERDRVYAAAAVEQRRRMELGGTT